MSIMVDTSARRRLGELARHLAAGRITNEDFEVRRPDSAEHALHDIYFYGLWPLYDDFVTHRLIGRRALTPAGRTWVARIVLFLRSDLPYRYPRQNPLFMLLVLPLSIVTLGWFGKLWLRFQWRHGDLSVWPFYTREEYERAIRIPTYLAGGSGVQRWRQYDSR